MGNPVKEFNILLLGETGSGKSTYVNSLSTFMKYESFAEANDDSTNIDHPISCAFDIENPVTGENLAIVSGKENKNECHQVGKSVTRSPTGYIFKFKNSIIRMIDTPGMGDTEGVEADSVNFEKILSYLQFHKKLHGVCVFLKSTNTKQTPALRYCFTQLLKYLHKSATKNFVFVYTFSSSTYFRASDSFTMINNFLSTDLKNLGIKQVAGENAFFFDSDVFRYLLAKRQNCEFEQYQIDAVSAGWSKTVGEINKMFSHITSLEAHNLESTSSLNYAKKLLCEIANPLVRIQVHLQETIDNIAVELNRLQQQQQSQLVKEKNNKSSKFILYDLETVELNLPATVCTSLKCIQVLQPEGAPEPIVDYIKRCHEPCYLKSVDTNRPGQPDLKFCAAMNQDNSNTCLKCGCPWSVHMHVMFRYEKVMREQIIYSEESNDAESSMKEYVYSLKKALKYSQSELSTIKGICSKLGVIIKTNSNLPSHVFIDPYMEQLIAEEKLKNKAFPEHSQANLERLAHIRESHQTDVQTLVKTLAGSEQENVGLEAIENYRNELIRLPQSGPVFKKIFKTIEANQEKVLVNVDVLARDFSGTKSNSSIVEMFNHND